MGIRSFIKAAVVNRRIKRQVNSKLKYRLELAQSVFSDAEVLRLLAQDRSVQVRQFVAANVATPNDVIHKLILDSNQMVRCNLAKRFDLSNEHIDLLVNDRSENVLVALALRDKLTAEQERALLEGGTAVRQKLALRKKLHPSVSIELAEDPDKRVRIILAGMTQNNDVLEKLDREDDFDIKLIVSKRKGRFDPQDVRWKRRNRNNVNGPEYIGDSWVRNFTSKKFNHESPNEQK